MAWLNAMLGRLLWDFLGEAHWAEMVSKKIQMKLSKIRVGGPRLLGLPQRWFSEAPVCGVCERPRGFPSRLGALQQGLMKQAGQVEQIQARRHETEVMK